MRRLRPLIVCLAIVLGGCRTAAAPVEDALPRDAERAATANRERVTVPAGGLAFVRAEAVTGGGTTQVVEAPARVVFRDSAQVGAPVAGRVHEVHVRVGDRVQAGSRLVTLGSSDAAGERAELRRARAVLRAAKLELERQTALSQRGVGLARDRVEAEAALAQAETELARTQQANALLGAGRGGVVDVLAPIDGVVLGRAVTRGTVVEPGGDPMIVIGDPNAVWIVADVFEDELDRIPEDARATIEVPGKVAPLEARVAALGGAVDPKTRRAPVWLALEAQAQRPRAGTFVRATIEAGEPAEALVPTSSIVLQGGTRAVVYVTTDQPGVFERRAVAVGRPFHGRTPVLEGLAPDDQVVVEGVLLLDAAAEQLL